MSIIRHSRAILRTSDSPNMRKSMISTSFTNDMAPGFEDLTRSQIQNLPSHCKSDLNSDFVVVFQGIEIERLSTEVEWSRVRIKELERQSFTTDNYEVQIRELTDRIFAFERNKELYMQENEKMNMICQQLYGELEDLKKRLAGVDFSLGQRYELEKTRGEDLAREVENWKNRYVSLDRSRTKQLEDMKQLMESQRKSILDREMRELTLRFQTERHGLEGQIRKLRDAVDSKVKALSEADHENGRNQMAILDLKKSLAQAYQNQNRVNVLKQQNSRLAEMLGASQQQLDHLMVREYQMTQKLKDQQKWQSELRQTRQQLELKQREAEDWRVRYTNSEENLQQMQQVQHQNIHLANQLHEAEGELDKLHNLLEQKVEELEEYKRRLARQQAETARYRNLQNHIDGQDKKIMGLTTQIDRVNMLLKARLGDLDQMKFRCQQLEQVNRRIPELERQNIEMDSHLKELSMREEELLSKLSRCETEMRVLKLNQKKLQQAEERNVNIERQANRLNSLVKSKHQELEDAGIRLRKLEECLRQSKETEARLRECQNEISQMSLEMERLSNAVRAKTEETSRIKSRNNSLEEQLSFLKSFESKLIESEKTINNLSLDLENSRREFSRLEDKLRGTDVKLMDAQRRAATALQDKDRLSKDLKAKSNEAEDLRSRLSRVEGELGRLRVIEQSYGQLQNEVAMVSADLERTGRQLKNLERQLDRERKGSIELQGNLRNATSQLEKYRTAELRQSKEFNQMKAAIAQLGADVKDRDENMGVLLDSVAAFESKVAYLMGELERYVAILNETDEKMCSLEDEIQQYGDYAKRITILSAEIDRLTNENRGLDEDGRRIKLKFAGQISGEMRHEQLCLVFCMLCAEIDALRSRVHEKENNVQEIRRSILEPIRNLNSQIKN